MRCADFFLKSCQTILYFIFFSLSFLFSIYGNRTVRIRWDKKESALIRWDKKQSALLNECYAWEPKIRDFVEFLIKIWKILCFGFSQIYSFLPIRIRGGKIGPARWASPVRPKLGPGWAIKLLARKKPAKFGPARPNFFFP